VEYYSGFDVCFIDWASYEPVLYSSGLRSSSNSQRINAIHTFHDLLMHLHLGVRSMLPPEQREVAKALFTEIAECQRFAWMLLPMWRGYDISYSATVSDGPPQLLRDGKVSPKDRVALASTSYYRKYAFYSTPMERRPPGRPRIYTTEAERARAYRRRKKTGRQILDKFGIPQYDTDLVVVSGTSTGGLGVIAKVAIPNGSLITRYEGRVLPPVLLLLLLLLLLVLLALVILLALVLVHLLLLVFLLLSSSPSSSSSPPL